MATPVETAARTYIQAAETRDPTERGKLLEACFAETARFVTRSTVFHGRAGVDGLIDKLLSDPQFARIELTTRVDAIGTTFRFGSRVHFQDGRSADFFDAGEIDADGKIVTILVFAGAL